MRPIASFEPVEPFDPNRWERSPSYAWGFDLLNHGFPWEAHEVWERVWRTVDRASPPGLLLQALIKLAAAHVKLLQAKPDGARRHARSAKELAGRITNAMAPEPALMGIDLRTFADAAREFERTGSCDPIELGVSGWTPATE